MLTMSVLSLEESIKEDVNLIRGDPLFGIKRPEVIGLLYDVQSGLVSQVV